MRKVVANNTALQWHHMGQDSLIRYLSGFVMLRRSPVALAMADDDCSEKWVSAAAG